MSTPRTAPRRTRGLMILLLISVATTLLRPVSPAAASPAGGVDLLFTEDIGDGVDLFAQTPERLEDHPRRIGNDGGDKLEPTVSPDGRRIAFVSTRDGNREIYVMDRNGQNQTRLTFTPYDESEPDWSNQNRIAYVARSGFESEIFVMNPDGTGQDRLTTNTWADASPSWSPTGTQLTYASRQTGPWDVWTMSSTGTNPVNLTESTHVDNEPDWSPDGFRIVFTSNRNANRRHIYRISSTGTQLTPVTSGNHDNAQAAWAPDSDHIAFVSTRDGQQELYIVSAETTLNASSITESPSAESTPVWTTTCDAPFGDTPAWVRDAVDWHWCRGFMTGYPDNTFRADLSITRAQLVRMLYREAGSPRVDELPPHGLSDVPAWVERAVRWAKGNNNIMTGYPDGTFRPNQPITRGQTVRAVHRSNGSPDGPPHPFSDVPAWLTDAVNWASWDSDGAGPGVPIMTGYPDNTFRDTLDITRAQTTRLVCRANAPVGAC